MKDALINNEEEKREIQKHYQQHLELINELKLEIEDWKSKAVLFFFKYILTHVKGEGLNRQIEIT